MADTGANISLIGYKSTIPHVKLDQTMFTMQPDRTKIRADHKTTINLLPPISNTTKEYFMFKTSSQVQ